MIHPTAIVDSSAEIHPSAEIGPFNVIGPDVVIDEGTIVGPHNVIKGPTRIGKNNRIYQFNSIGEDTPDLKYAGEATILEIGDNNVIRENVTIHRGTVQDRGETIIGNNNLLMAYVHIGHDCRLSDNIIMVNNASISGHCDIGDWAILSGMSGVHQFCSVGAHAFVGGYGYVNKDVPAFVTCAGSPVSPKTINSEGLRRRGFTEDTIRNINRAYKTLYRRKLSLDDAVEQLKQQALETPEIQAMLDSIANSKRGIIR